MKEDKAFGECSGGAEHLGFARCEDVRIRPAGLSRGVSPLTQGERAGEVSLSVQLRQM